MANISELSAEANITNEALDFKAAFLRDIKGNVTLQEYSDNKVKLSNDVVYEIRRLDSENDPNEKYAIFRNDVKIAANVEKNTASSSEYVLNNNFFTYVPNMKVVTTNWIYSDGVKKNIEFNSYLVGNESSAGVQSGVSKTYGTDIREVVYHSNDEDNKTKKQFISEINKPNVLANMFSKNGYVVAGYSTTSTGSLEYFVGDIIPDTVTDLFAIWRKVSDTITVVFDAHDGVFSGGYSENTVKYNLVRSGSDVFLKCIEGQYAIPQNSPSIFTGWSIREDLGGQIYKSVAELKDVAYDNLHLYATFADADCTYMDGANLNIKLKTIAGDLNATQTSDNLSIKKIIWTNEEIDPSLKDDSHRISTGSTPIYAWFDADVIYIWSEGKYPKFGNSISYLFSGLKNLESSNLAHNFGVMDTSYCTSMEYLFNNCLTITQIDTSMIDPSSCDDLSHMFDGCKFIKNIDISHFKTGSIENFAGMFASCESLEKIDLSNLNTSSATDLNNMFNSCKSLTSIDVSNFNVRNAKNMSWMFSNCENLLSLDVSNWRPISVEDLEGTFSDLSRVERIDLSNFNTENCVDMRCLFRGCSRIRELNLSSLDTSNVETQEKDGNKLSLSMFSGCSNLETITFGPNCTFEKVEVFESLFQNCTKLKSLDLSMFNTSNATNMRSMFNSCENLEELNLTSFNTVNVKTFNNFLFNCGKLLRVDLSSFSTSECLDFINMFARDASLKTIYASDLFIASTNSDTSSMFDECRNLVGGRGTRYSYSTNYKPYVRIDGGSGAEGYFTGEISEHAIRAGDQYYESIQEAINNSLNNTKTTLVLLKNISENFTVPSGKIIDINLNNHQLTNHTANNSKAIIENNGHLTISTGTIYSTCQETASINNNKNATLILKGNLNISSIGAKQVVYNNGARLEIQDNVYIKANSNIRATIHALNSATTIISGGTIVSEEYYAVLNDSNSTLIIGDSSNGVRTTPTLRGYSYGIYNNNNTPCEVYDGTIMGRTAAINNENQVRTGAECKLQHRTETIKGEVYNVTYVKYVELETIYQNNGNYVFDGTNPIIINTPLFSSENAGKNFSISFNIVSYDSSNEFQSTLLSCKNEDSSLYTGFSFRYKDASGALEFSCRDGTQISSGTISPIAEGMRITVTGSSGIVKFYQHDVVKYQYDYSNLTHYFNLPITIGSSYKNNAPFRPFKGTLSNIVVKVEKD